MCHESWRAFENAMILLCHMFRLTTTLLAGLLLTAVCRAEPSPTVQPNVILCMTDDQGWGDTGYNGHDVLRTPHLDAMSKAGLRFDRWYAGAPVCSPTRGSCMTGRHPYRYGIFSANVGHMKKEEVTLAEALKTRGYATGHFGKWHLGTLTTRERDSNRGGRKGTAKHYSPPWENGFDVCFSTEAKVPTYDPMVTPGRPPKGSGKGGKPYGTYYWTGAGKKATDNLKGDDSRVIMDRAIPFIETAARKKQPFLAVIWFHTPHLPVVAGPRYLAMYADQPEEARHYLGCITAMDEQLGRLRKKLRELGVAPNTMLWFSSDNGPEGKRRSPRRFGSAGPFRGRKRSLYEGGVRVPGLLEWPAKIKQARVVQVPSCTSDYVPTIMDALGLRTKSQPEPFDGVSLMPLIEGRMKTRPRPIGFQSGKQVSLSDNRYKIYSANGGTDFELYDLIADPGEKTNLAAAEPNALARLKNALAAWRNSCRLSLEGADY
jgi:arylsulfatase A-like enzyme